MTPREAIRRYFDEKGLTCLFKIPQREIWSQNWTPVVTLCDTNLILTKSNIKIDYADPDLFDLITKYLG